MRTAPLVRWMLPVLAVSFALLLGEAALRLFFHAAPQLEADIYERREGGVLFLRANLTRRHVTPRWDFRIETNADGLRGRPIERGVILGLGDSQAFGWGVAEEQTFYRLAERQTGRAILNAAVPGTGPGDYARTFHLLASRVEPRTAVVAVFVGNDFSDAARGGSDQFAVVDGFLTRREAAPVSPGRRMRDWLARRSHVLQLLRAWQFNWTRQGPASGAADRIWDSWMREFAAVHFREPGPLIEEGFERTAEALKELHEGVDRLYVLAIPRSWQVDRDELDEMQRALRVDAAALDLDRPQRFLLEWCQAHQATFVNPLEEMRAKADTEVLFYTPDAHMTAAGHQVVARVLSQALAAD